MGEVAWAQPHSQVFAPVPHIESPMQLSAGVFRPLARYRVAVVLLLAAACQHDDAFRSTPAGGEEPREPGPPVRLTYATFEDQYAGWLQDGSGVLYTYVNTDSRSRDRCLGLLPATGGQVRVTRCSATDGADDSTDAYNDATALDNNRFAWVEQHGLRGRQVPDRGAVMIGALRYGSPTVKLTSFPYTATSGNTHLSGSNLRRVNATQLAYIGVDLVPRPPCQGCKPDTLVIWHEVMLLDINGGPMVMLTGSDQTSSIWPDADGTGLYYTVTGDTRVYHRLLAGGATETVHDFGALGIARDVSVAGNQLAAIVGGKVSYGFDGLIGAPLQFDSGGRLFTVDLSNGSEQEPYFGNTRFRRPAVAPDGRSLVVEGVDSTTTNILPDLWLVPLQ